MTHQLNFIYNDSDWVCPSEYPDLSKAKEIAKMLRNDEDFYLYCSNIAKTKYKESFHEKSFISNNNI